MKATDVMTRDVVAVTPDTPVEEVARQMIARGVSAVPVVDAEGHVLGIVSEGDLLRRPELGTERQPSWWLRLLGMPEERAAEYVRTHGRHARDVMTREVVTVEEDTPIEEIADLLESHRIKRVPVVRDGRLVGIVSRADIVRALATRALAAAREGMPTVDDATLRRAIERALGEAGVRHEFVSVLVENGVACLWGVVDSPEEREAARVAAENVPGVRAVQTRLAILPPAVRAAMGAE